MLKSGNSDIKSKGKLNNSKFGIRYKNWGIKIILMNEKCNICNYEFIMLRDNRNNSLVKWIYMQCFKITRVLKLKGNYVLCRIIINIIIVMLC